METFSHETFDPNWVTGFADSTGSFTYSRSAKQIALYFAIKLPASDQPTLEAIRAFFGVGKIYRTTSAARATSYFRVTHREDLQQIVGHFDAYPLRSSKRHTYAIWRSMVQLKLNFRRPDRVALETLADQLSSIGRLRTGSG